MKFGNSSRPPPTFCQGYRMIIFTLTCIVSLPLYYYSTTAHGTRYTLLTKTHPGLHPSLNLTLPGQSTPYYINLSQYPIEAHLIKLFPQFDMTDTIRKITLHNLQHRRHNRFDHEAWSSRWLNQTMPAHALGCEHHLPPYPILRHLVKHYLNLQDATDFYDTREDDIIPHLKHPVLFLPILDLSEMEFQPGTKICLRVVVPYQNKSSHPFKPARESQSPWWDTFLTSLKQFGTDASQSISLEPWPGHALLRPEQELPPWARHHPLHERTLTHLYQAELEIPQEPGWWELSSLMEFSEAQYNLEEGPAEPYAPTLVPFLHPSHRRLRVVVTSDEADKTPTGRYPALDILLRHMALPLCQTPDAPGRWLPFPHETPTSRAILQSIRKRLIGLTRHGKYWAPYSCRYRHLTYEDFNRCAAQQFPRGINLFGDSNLRRSLKKFLSHGKWCAGWERRGPGDLLPSAMVVNGLVVNSIEAYRSPQHYGFYNLSQTRSCFCEDYEEFGWQRSWLDPTRRVAQGLVLQNDLLQSQLLGNASGRPDRVELNFYKWDGLTYLNQPGWDEAIGSLPTKVDLVVFSLGNWDAAFSSLESFRLDLVQLMHQIRAEYDLESTKIVYRTSQYYCCRVDTSRRARQVNSPRMVLFDQEARKVFREALGAVIWDVYGLGDSRSLEEKISNLGCSANHVPADEVEIENQLLMNALCNTQS